jgi:hypothetical protein
MVLCDDTTYSKSIFFMVGLFDVVNFIRYVLRLKCCLLLLTLDEVLCSMQDSKEWETPLG